MICAECIDAERRRVARWYDTACFPSRLDQFLRDRHLPPPMLAKESGYSESTLLRIRLERLLPNRRCIAALVAASRRLLNDPSIRATDLFAPDE